MQYILTEEEFHEYQSLLKTRESASSDEAKMRDFMGSLAALRLSHWQQVSGRIPADVVADIDKLYERSKQQLLQEWRHSDPDFFNRKLA